MFDPATGQRSQVTPSGAGVRILQQGSIGPVNGALTPCGSILLVQGTDAPCHAPQTGAVRPPETSTT